MSDGGSGSDRQEDEDLGDLEDIEEPPGEDEELQEPEPDEMPEYDMQEESEEEDLGEENPGESIEALFENDDESDSNYLYEPQLGFEEQANIKVPLVGYTDADQNSFFPLIDEQSGVLFEIVQEYESEQLKSSEKILRAYKEPVVIPPSRYALTEGGPEIKLRILDPSTREDAIIKRAVAMASSSDKIPDRLLAAIAKDAFPPDKLAMLMVPLEKGWKREIVMRSHGGASNKKLGDVYYFSPEGIKFRSSKQVALHLAKTPELNMTIDNFTFAKARVSYDPNQETVRQAHGGRGSAPINPVKPIRSQPKAASFNIDDGYENRNGMESEYGEDEERKATVVRGGRRSIQPPKRYATGETVFHSEKRPKMSKQVQQEKEYEDYGGMEMGMLPPKYPRGMEDTNHKGSVLTGEEQYADFKRRGRPPKPGGKKDLLAQAEAMKAAKSAAGSGHYQYPQEEDGELFGISAFNQTGMWKDGGHYSEDYDEYSTGTYMKHKNDMSKGNNEGNDGADDGLSHDTEELLPCSIRCPGMTGEIPTLQCIRCLCLYHPGCLGLPAQNYRNFFCANCEGGPGEQQQQQRQTAGGMASDSRPQNKQVKMVGDMGRAGRRSSPPPLIQLTKVGLPRITKMAMQPQPLRKLLPKMPSLQPPGSGYFARGGGQQQPRMRGRMDNFPRLNPPNLRMVKRPEGGEGGRPTGNVSSMDMRRGRGRPPRNLMIPQLNNRSLTITPISIPRRGGIQAPVVPRLQPMLSSRGGMMSRGGSHQMHPQMRQQSIRPGRPPLKTPAMISAQARASAQAIYRQKNQLNVMENRVSHQSERNDRFRFQDVREYNAQAQFRPPPQTNFKRYAQSVVTINQRKYIVLPKSKPTKIIVTPVDDPYGEELELDMNGDAEEGAEEEDAGGDRGNEMEDKSSWNRHTCEDEPSDLPWFYWSRNGKVREPVEEEKMEKLDNYSKEEQKFILRSVFEKLGTIDKLRCRQVSKLWSAVGSEPDLWEELCLTNLRITNWKEMTAFVMIRRIKAIDARGYIIGEPFEKKMNEFWDELSMMEMYCATNMVAIMRIIITKEMSEYRNGAKLKLFMTNFPHCEMMV